MQMAAGSWSTASFGLAASEYRRPQRVLSSAAPWHNPCAPCAPSARPCPSPRRPSLISTTCPSLVYRHRSATYPDAGHPTLFSSPLLSSAYAYRLSHNPRQNVCIITAPASRCMPSACRRQGPTYSRFLLQMYHLYFKAMGPLYYVLRAAVNRNRDPRRNQRPMDVKHG
ncbi:hypothetical protein DFH09DRAFT_1177473 [Mycena vulgaris]|nr:hypothetical protein DFH09DRAFT_1177473 [Mycena vulgaris]